ncbi:MAG: hypothetical protein U0Q12_03020 [Vicinamibacterales bacterium]
MARRAADLVKTPLARGDRGFDVRIGLITRPGTAMVAWKSVTAVTSARVSSFAKPSPSGSVFWPHRSVELDTLVMVEGVVRELAGEMTFPA